jgi:hypothetical protein
MAASEAHRCLRVLIATWVGRQRGECTRERRRGEATASTHSWSGERRNAPRSQYACRTRSRRFRTCPRQGPCRRRTSPCRGRVPPRAATVAAAVCAWRVLRVKRAGRSIPGPCVDPRFGILTAELEGRPNGVPAKGACSRLTGARGRPAGASRPHGRHLPAVRQVRRRCLPAAARCVLQWQVFRAADAAAAICRPRPTAAHEPAARRPADRARRPGIPRLRGRAVQWRRGRARASHHPHARGTPCERGGPPASPAVSAG